MSSLYRRNGIYWISWPASQSETGKPFCQPLRDPEHPKVKIKDRSTALYVWEKLNRSRRGGLPILPSKDIPCLAVLEKYRKNHQHDRAKKTNESQYRRVKAFLDWSKISTFGEITSDIFRDYLNRRIEKDHISPYTANSIRQHISTWLNECVQNHYIVENPLRYVKRHRTPPKDVRFLSKIEIKYLLAASQEPSLYVDRKPTLYAYLVTGLYAGLRPAETATLDWPDFDFTRQTIRIHAKQDFTPKDYENRTIPLNKKLAPILWPLRKREGRCFDTTNKRRIFKRIKNKAVELAAEDGIKINMSSVTLYTMRHTFASHALMSGVPLSTVSKWLGHASIKTTMIYSHLLEDHQQDEMQKVDF